MLFVIIFLLFSTPIILSREWSLSLRNVITLWISAYSKVKFSALFWFIKLLLLLWNKIIKFFEIRFKRIFNSSSLLILAIFLSLIGIERWYSVNCYSVCEIFFVPWIYIKYLSRFKGSFQVLTFLECFFFVHYEIV